MRNLTITDKQIIDKILACGLNTLSPVCDIASGMFLSGQTALLLCNKAYLLRCGNFDVSSVQAQLIAFVSLLTELQHEGFVYLVNYNTCNQLLIQKDLQNEVWITDNVLNTNLGKLKFDGTKGVCISTAENAEYIGNAYSEGYSKILFQLLTSYICPTEKLRKYKDVGYLSDDAVRYKKELCYTRIGLAVSLFALLLSIVSPFWVTKWQTKYQCDYNNEHSYTTINGEEHHEYLRELNHISSTLDSIVLNNPIKEIIPSPNK